MTRLALLSDDMWARIEPLLPPTKGPMGPPFRPHRPVVEAVLYRLRTGVAWRDLPKEFGAWQTVHRRHQSWSRDGVWDEILATLQADADVDGEVDWRVSMDSTIARVHQHGATAARSSVSPFSHTGGGTE
ncbi:IS5 family transposase [Nonomuraea sp. 3N208]|uniref:IS5 family transposase n=1 Tax=Nonomuraea sp. 3N208 TaxID=3457421 RepID=UPI003FCEA040